MSLHIVLSYLDKPEYGQLDFILTELHSTGSSNYNNTDLEHICSRVVNLLRNYHLYNNFQALKVIQILCRLNNSSAVLSSHGSEFFIKINKAISNLNSYQNSNTQEQVRVVLQNAIEAVNVILQETKGKPALTRDAVTPNLPNFIGECIAAISIEPYSTVKILHRLIQTNTTTFRPFGTKFENKLVALIKGNNKMDKELTQVVYESYVYCKFILSQKNNQDMYGNFVNDLFIEIKSVLKIYYESFIDLENSNMIDIDQRLPGNGNDQFVANFEPLEIDANRSESIYAINDRLDKLISILHATFTTKHDFKIQLGTIVSCIEIATSFNTRFVQLKREFRFIDLKTVLNRSIQGVQEIGITLLTYVLEDLEIQGALVPHFNQLLSSLEYSVPDSAEIIPQETFVLSLLRNATKILKLVYNYTDHSMLTRLIDSALKLCVVQRTVSLSTTTSDTSSGKKKTKKSHQKTNLALSDLISHGDLFIKDIPTTTITTVNEFFETVISNVVIPGTKKTQIIKHALLQLLHQKQTNNNTAGSIDQSLEKLLKSILANPSKDSVNILPFVSDMLANNNDYFNLFINPRLPPLAQVVRLIDAKIDEEEEESEEELEEFDAAPVQEQDKMEMDTTPVSQPEPISEQVMKKRKMDIETKYSEELLTTPIGTINTTSATTIEIQPAPPQQHIEVQVQAEREPESDDDDGSEIEIPDIDMSSDEE